ncbi:MAG: VWA domain-containing protein [Deltaproteobacteria bacterium]|nr:MAG: VWA domain-containing protein [Deltaproteobacteria bacterium]
MKVLPSFTAPMLAAVLGFGGGAVLLGSIVRFAAPGLLALVLVPIGLTFVYVAHLRWHHRVTAALGDASTVRAMSTGVVWRRRHVQATLVLLSLFLVVLATARPQWGEQPRHFTRSGIDIAIVFDLSRSMLAEDVPPSRLQSSVEEMDRFLRQLRGHRVALVPFAGIAWRQSPLTVDHGTLRTYLRRLHPDDIPVQGTATAAALELAGEALLGTEQHPVRRAPSQLIVLVGDGEDHEGDPVAVARRLHEEHGIIVFAVGVGTPEGARIPVRDARGRPDWFRDRAGNIVHTVLERDQLVAVAEAGGGAFLHLDAEGRVAAALLDALRGHDGMAFEPVVRMEYADRFGVFLLPAIVLLLLALFLGTPRPPMRRLLTALFLAALLPGACADGLQREDRTVREAIRLAESGSVEEALALLDEADPVLRDDPLFAYNRGLLLHGLDRHEEARDAFLLALGTDDPALEADALNGLGVTLLALDDVEEAHLRFRRALRLDPDHADARRNLEIAHRRLFPPCAELDDFFSPNHSPGSAVHLPDVFYASPPEDAPPLPEDADERLVLCPGRPDHFAVRVFPGDRVSAVLRLERLRDDTGGDALPARGPRSQVGLTLLDTGHLRPFAEAPPDTAERSLDRFSRALPETEIPATVDPAGELALIRLDAVGPTEFEGRLEVTLEPGCRRLKGHPAGVGSAHNPVPLPAGDHALIHCAGDEDWYGVDVRGVEVLFLDVHPLVDREDSVRPLEVTVLPARGERPLAVASPDERGLVEVRVDPATAGDVVRVRVRGGDGAEGSHTIGVYPFQPCPVADRHAPNFSPAQRASLEPADFPVRHLRLCEGRAAWFEVGPFALEDGGAEDPQATDPLLFVTRSEQRDQEILAWTLTGAALSELGDPAPASEVADPLKPFQRAVAFVRPADTDRVVLRVAGEPGFYHLDSPDLQPPPDEGDGSGDGDDDSSAGDDDSSAGDDDPSAGDDDPSAGDDADGSDREDGDDRDAPEEDSSGDDDGDPSGQDGEDDSAGADDDDGEDSSDEEAPGPDPGLDDEERRLLLNLLDSLEEQGNLPLQRALQGAPPRQREREW